VLFPGSVISIANYFQGVRGSIFPRFGIGSVVIDLGPGILDHGVASIFILPELAVHEEENLVIVFCDCGLWLVWDDYGPNGKGL